MGRTRCSPPTQPTDASWKLQAPNPTSLGSSADGNARVVPCGDAPGGAAPPVAAASAASRSSRTGWRRSERGPAFVRQRSEESGAEGRVGEEVGFQ